MKTINGKKKDNIKLVAINLRKEGNTYLSISKIIGDSISTVWNWCQNYNKNDKDGLINKKKGAKLGINRKLTDNQLIKLKKRLIDKTPMDFNLIFFGANKQFDRCY